MSDESNKIPAGYYPGRAIAGSEQYGRTSGGHDQIVLDLDIPSLGRKLTTFLTFSDASAQYSLDRLRACGWAGDDVTNLAGIDANEVDIGIKYKPKQNGVGEQMEVSIMTGSGGYKIKDENKLTDQERRGFGARMKQFIKQGAPSVGTRPAPRPTQRQAPPVVSDADDSDIPF